jgi:hypothetical protein
LVPVAGIFCLESFWQTTKWPTVLTDAQSTLQHMARLELYVAQARPTYTLDAAVLQECVETMERRQDARRVRGAGSRYLAHLATFCDEAKLMRMRGNFCSD